MNWTRTLSKKPFGYGIFPEETMPQNYLIKSECSNEKPFDPFIGVLGKKGEPLSLAEQLSHDRAKGLFPHKHSLHELLKPYTEIDDLAQLKQMPVLELIREARRLDATPTLRRKLLQRLINYRIRERAFMFGEGTLEILPDLFGFLRSTEHHFMSHPDDIYISPSQIRRFGLRQGCVVSGQIRPPKEKEQYFALLKIESINHEPPSSLSSRALFSRLPPIHPNRQIRLQPFRRPTQQPESTEESGLRLIDQFIPLGFGQRGLIVGPPQTGKTALLRQLIISALKENPDLYGFFLMIEERPEEVNEMVRRMKIPRCEVIASLFDEPQVRHTRLAELVLEKAQRMVEYGKDVLICLDSLTRLGRFGEAEAKRFFSAARNIDGDGSLTIIAAVTEPVNSFFGSCNWVIRLDGLLAGKGIYPAIDVRKSGTRNDEYLLDGGELQYNAELRQSIAELSTEKALLTLLDEGN